MPLRLAALAALSAVLSGSLASAADSSPTATERLDQARAALREARTRSDWAASVTAAQQIKQLLNASPQSRLEVARAEVLAGDSAAASRELKDYVRMGQSSDAPEKLPDFASLRRQKEFAAMQTAMAVNRQSVARSTVAFHIPDAGLLPEDMGFDPRSRRFLISSVLQHRIVSVGIAGDAPLAEFAKAPDDWPVFALKVDATRQMLWATESAIEGFDTMAKSDQGRSAVVCYDLTTGKLLRRIEGPRPGALGDITLSADGSVIVSDGQHGGLYRLAPGQDQLVRLDRGDFISPQTVAMAPDATHAFVPDYLRGIGVLDLKTREVRWLPMEGRFALAGIDGLYRVGRQLIAVQNGTSPERVVLFSMDIAGPKIVAEQVIERATATLGDPTHGVVVGDTFYYIANSGWDALGDNGLVRAGATLTSAVVMKWKLPGK